MSHPDEILGQRFQLGVLNTSKILLIYTILHILSHFFLAVQDVLLNRISGSSLFTLKIYQKTTILCFSSSYLGTFFGHPCLNTTTFGLDATLSNLEFLINDRYPFFLTLVPELLEHIIYFCWIISVIPTLIQKSPRAL